MLAARIRRSLKLSCCIAIAIILIHGITYAPPYTPQATDKIKGVWLTHVGTSFLTYTSLIDNVFHNLSQQNYNTVYVDVYNGGVTYPSQHAPRNNLISFPFTNPLKTAIKQGKRQGLHIYGWYEHGMMVFPNRTIATQHPDWLLTTPDGKQYIEEHLWLNPEHPEVKQYFINLFTEAARKYPDLHGIQVDDHWGIPLAFGDKTQGMTELTRAVFSAVKQANPNLVISLSPNPYQFSLTKYSQDWLKWLQEYLFQEIVMQIYRTDSDSVAQSLATSGIKESSRYADVAVGIFAGGSPQLKSLTETNNQVEVVKSFGYGHAIFCWEYTSIPVRKLVYLVRKINRLISS